MRLPASGQGGQIERCGDVPTALIRRYASMSVKKMPRRSPALDRAAQQSGRRQEALALLGALDCLRDVPASELACLLDIATFRSFQTGATVLGQQRQDKFLFLVLRGTLQ